MQAGCATVAILLHYFFITSFMWMLMEGVVLHIMLVNVFSFKHVGRRYYIGFTLLCYGMYTYDYSRKFSLVIMSFEGGPLLYMALCVPLGLTRTNEWSYGNDNLLVSCCSLAGPQLHCNIYSCWLTYDDNFIWVFIAPIILILLVRSCSQYAQYLANYLN